MDPDLELVLCAYAAVFVERSATRMGSVLQVCALPDVVRLAYPAREFAVELVQAGYPELMHEKPLGVRRRPEDARVVTQFPLQVQVAVE